MIPVVKVLEWAVALAALVWALAVVALAVALACQFRRPQSPSSCGAIAGSKPELTFIGKPEPSVMAYMVTGTPADILCPEAAITSGHSPGSNALGSPHPGPATADHPPA
jgi:hypothetical protein